jgi:flavin-binding protein dodecin
MMGRARRAVESAQRRMKCPIPFTLSVEVVGTSEHSISKAFETAIDKASQSLRHLGWFEVAQVRGNIDGGKVNRYQVTLKVGFSLEQHATPTL